ncbi:unnamed protein product [Onchocerca flexuosa]|uniref:Ovule protein n=1 Tax=Onchocerca flexuosa TaxID=387005 RepID=A0A183HBR9_9BILA|nr:unnamed protein product [Onchocerca flexuosa]
MTYFGYNALQDAHEFLIKCKGSATQCYASNIKLRISKNETTEIQSLRIAVTVEFIIRCKNCDVAMRKEEESAILSVSIHMLETSWSW